MDLFSHVRTILGILYVVFIIINIILVVHDKRDPIKALSWITVMVALPVMGLILYLFFGRNLRKQKIFDRKEAIDQEALDKATRQQVYDINKVKPEQMLMMQLYPEIYCCIGCNACTKSCTQELNVMQYIAAAQRGDFAECAEMSFDCVMCGVCSSRCPAGISHPQVAMLARRLNGKYIAPEALHLTERVKEIEDGLCTEAIEAMMAKPIAELKELYNNRDIEK